MTEEPATATYCVGEPFPEVVRSLRKLLGGGNLKVSAELDLSRRIRDKLRIDTAPCVVLFVSAPAVAFETDPRALALAPLHVVISGRDLWQTEIHTMRALPRDHGTLDASTLAALNHAQAEISRAIEKIGMRVTLAV